MIPVGFKSATAANTTVAERTFATPVVTHPILVVTDIKVAIMSERGVATIVPRRALRLNINMPVHPHRITLNGTVKESAIPEDVVVNDSFALAYVRKSVAAPTARGLRQRQEGAATIKDPINAGTDIATQWYRLDEQLRRSGTALMSNLAAVVPP